MAGPGTGKTDVFAWRVKDLIEQSDIEPDEILVLSFSRMAAGELGRRIHKYRSKGESPTPSTLHSYALARLRRAHAFSVCGNHIVDDWEMTKFFRQDITNHIGGTVGHTSRLLKGMAADWRTLRRDDKPLPAEQAALEAVLRKLRPVYDFALLPELVFRFKRWGQAEPSFKPKFKYMLVDEYQDLNKCDQAAVDLIQRRSGAEVMVAGDDDQSIYGWRDAAPDGIRNFPTKYEAESFDITACHRCGQNIIDDAWTVVEKVEGRAKKRKMRSTRKDPGAVHICRSETASQGITDVRRLLKHLTKTGQCATGQVLVLVSRSSFAKSYVRAFEKAGVKAINYVRPGEVLDRPRVRQLMYALRLGTDRDDPVALRAMLALAGGIGPVKIKEITADAIERQEPFPKAARRSNNAVVRETLNGIAALPDVDRTSHWPGALNRMAKQLKTPQGDVADLIAFVSTIVPDETEEIETCLLAVREFRVDKQSAGDYPPDGPVRVMTMGQAKGLSAEVVIVTDLDDEIVPGRLPEDEQRRLLYVAMTRAERLLYLFYCTGRRNSASAYAGIGGSRRPGEARSLSHFLQDLNHDACDVEDLIT
jgi:DNA helicase-2/ATP-dependent DNA helicase PcrA